MILALESSHAVWAGVQIAKTLPKDQDLVIVRYNLVQDFFNNIALIQSFSAYPDEEIRTLNRYHNSCQGNGPMSSIGMYDI